jgi:hypothetical protein
MTVPLLQVRELLSLSQGRGDAPLCAEATDVQPDCAIGSLDYELLRQSLLEANAIQKPIGV